MTADHPAIRVKPLEWRRQSTVLKADAGPWVYRVFPPHEDMTTWVWRFYLGTWRASGGNASSEAEAIAAAEADYERRVRELVEIGAGSAEGEKLETAAKPALVGSCEVAAEGPDAWLIRKGGYFYRPSRQGYTTNKDEAGRYTEARAKAEARVEPSNIRAILADDVPNPPRHRRCARAALGAEVKALCDAARSLLDGMQSTYRAGNNRQVGIEADDGEKCWIVHSDLTHELENALSALTPEPPSDSVADHLCDTTPVVSHESGSVRRKPADGGAAELGERPERIWLDKDGLWTSSEWLGGTDHKDGLGPLPEYVLADKLTAVHAERDRLLDEVTTREDALFGLVRKAFLRGAEWHQQHGDDPLIGKAACDHADAATSANAEPVGADTADLVERLRVHVEQYLRGAISMDDIDKDSAEAADALVEQRELVGLQWLRAEAAEAHIEALETECARLRAEIAQKDAENGALREALADLYDAYVGQMKSEYDFPGDPWTPDRDPDAAAMAARAALAARQPRAAVEKATEASDDRG